MRSQFDLTARFLSHLIYVYKLPEEWQYSWINFILLDLAANFDIKQSEWSLDYAGSTCKQVGAAELKC
jgi:hypothetical protein